MGGGGSMKGSGNSTAPCDGAVVGVHRLVSDNGVLHKQERLGYYFE